MNRNFWKGKRVFLTGHTGFKGSWFALWLADMGAEVHGFALSAPTEPNFFTVSNVRSRLKSHTLSDIRNQSALVLSIKSANPEIVFHLAAQPLVRASYAQPAETFDVNVMGTVNLLEAIRQTRGVRVVVNVTSDKCYENREEDRPYREHEAMGGYDPYSSSKGCSELVTLAYRRSFLAPAGVHLASARSGNVIGGGDWATDRLIPDFLRAYDAGETLAIRSPNSTRPWQHVLEPLSGYLLLAEKLYTKGREFAEAWNFAPEEFDMRPVRWIVEHLSAQIPNFAWQCDHASDLHETQCLKLDNSKAKLKLNWRPRWNLETALRKTLDWHKAWKAKSNMKDFSLAQILEFERSGKS